MKNYSKKSKKETPAFTVNAIRRTTTINVFSDEEKTKEPVIEMPVVTRHSDDIYAEAMRNQRGSSMR